MRLALKIALAHLRAPRKVSFSRYAAVMAMTGLGLGIAALILTFAILEGFERTLSEKLTEFDGHVRIEHFMDSPLAREDALVDSAIADLNVGFHSYEYIRKAAVIRSKGAAEGVLVEAYDGEVSPVLPGFDLSGSAHLDDNSAVVGIELARKLGLEIGNKIVLFDLSNIYQVGAARRMAQFAVTGIYHSGLQDYDNTMVYITISAAQHLFAMDGKITGQVLYLEDNNKVKAVCRTLDNRLGYPYFVISWKEKHKVLFDWMAVQKWPILVIFGLIALVGLVNIISALAMIVLEKIRAIGILKSMGLPKRTVKLIFLLEGGIIGLIGSLSGTLVAVTLTVLQNNFRLFSIPEEIYFMDHLPIDLNFITILIFVLAGTAATLLAALWPTNRAAIIEPAEALRYE